MIRNVTSFCVHEHKMTTNLSISSPRNMASYMGSQNMPQDIECDFPLPNQSMYMDAPDSGKLSRLRESSISAISSILRRPRGIDGSMDITSREGYPVWRICWLYSPTSVQRNVRPQTPFLEVKGSKLPTAPLTTSSSVTVDPTNNIQLCKVNGRWSLLRTEEELATPTTSS